MVDYPRTHNLLKLLNEANVPLNDEQVVLYTDMNQFQTRGRYPEELAAMEETVTKELCEMYLQKIKTEIEWLKNQMS